MPTHHHRVMLRAAGLMAALQFASAGEPPCNPQMEECAYYFDDAAFGDSLDMMQAYSLQSAHAIIKSDLRLYNATCNAVNWKRWETCMNDCPLQLKITSPPELQMTVCVQDNGFSPTVPGQHLDPLHPLNGKELELVAVGTDGSDTRHGCEESDFRDGKDYRGKMVLIQRGSCFFATKFQNAATAGGSAAVMVNSRRTNSILEQMVTMGGDSDGFPDLPAAMTPRHYGDILFEALDRGVTIVGTYQLKCPAGGIQPADSEDDGCPDTRLKGLCDTNPVAQNRLCARCPVDVELTNSSGRKESFCWWGNKLTPIKPATNVRTAWASDATPWQRDVVYLEAENGGCEQLDYSGLQGKAVVVPETGDCLAFHQMRMADAAGVGALIMLPPSSALVAPMIEGLSIFASIPVHSIHPEEVQRFLAFARTGTRVGGLRGSSQAWQLPASITPGGESTQAPTPAPTTRTVVERIEVESMPDFEWTLSVIIALVLIVVLFIAIILKMIEGNINSVKLPDEYVQKDGEAAVKLPLNCASMTLSLTLLLATAVVVFVLAYLAGKDSTDTAIEEGGLAVDRCHSNSVDNVQELATMIRQSAIRSVSQAVTDFLQSGETASTNAVQLYAFFDGTWDSFDKNWDLLVVQAQSTNWVSGMKTLQTFYADGWVKTNSFDPDDGSPSVSVTNDGSLYGLVTYWYDDITKRNDAWALQDLEEWPLHERVGNFFGDPFAMVKGKTKGFMSWKMIHYNLPNSFQGGTSHLANKVIVVLTPIFGEGDVYQGVCETSRFSPSLAAAANAAVRGASSGKGETQKTITENMTVVIYDAADGKLISTSRGWESTVRDVYIAFSATSAPESLTLLETHHAEQNALGSYIRKKNGGNWTGYERAGEFDQEEEYTEQDWQVFRFQFANGLADSTPHKYPAEVRDGNCGACLGNGKNGGGLQLDGDSLLYIYRNLTVDMPRVRERRAQGFRPYKDTCYAFGRRCVSVNECPSGPCSCPGRDGCGAEVVAYYDYTQTEWFPITTEPWTRLSASIMMWINPSEAIADDAFPSPQVAPRLFSDTFSGDSTIRWFANGVLYVRIGSAYGCLTKPISGGPKVGEWTHLAAVVDHWEEKCTVYVNGELHDQVTLTYRFRRFLAEVTALPVSVGYKFKGGMDDVTAVATAISGPEVKRMMENEGKFERIVQSRRWLMEFAPLKREDDTHTGIDWIVAAMIPREDIMRSVDSNNELLRRNLKVSEENTRKTLNQRTYDTIFIAVAIALFSVIVFFIFNDLLTRPFAKLACDMLDVAVLNTDSYEADSSVILELNAMMRAMRLMVENMKMYKRYMPATLLANYEDEEEEDDQSDAVTASRQSTGMNRGPKSPDGSHRSVSRSQRSSKGSVMSSRIGSRAEGSVAAFMKKQGKGAAMQVGLASKRVALLAANLNNWHRISSEGSEAGKVHQAHLTKILACIQAAKGIPDTFQGDRVFASWNAVKVCASFKQLAVQAACAIQAGLDQLQLEKLTCSFSVTGGEVKCGNIGTDTMRKFSFLSVVVPWTHALERYSRSLGVNLILVDENVYSDIKDRFNVRCAALVKFTKRFKDKTMMTYQCLGEQAKGADEEWMYQLEEKEKSNPWRFHDQVWRMLQANETSQIQDIKAQMTEPQAADGVDVKVQQALDKTDAYEPDEILYH
eukprot:TRINITY_DN24_c0_g1_i2.p1 TRINITY_DN24_c0_g1~~TRINITY_DN24_c0_g1_i2.p1  ORF type:complete len:1662 (+),score=580.18 TRINITY_DN24_c0_g1_i2:152-5137(+)